MSRNYRFILFLLAVSVLVILGLYIERDFNILISNFWFSSGLLLLILLSLIDQPHFSKDANIFVNAVTASISLILVKRDDYDWLFFLFTGITVYLVLSSYILMWIRNNPLNEKKKEYNFLHALIDSWENLKHCFQHSSYGEQ